MSSDRLAPILSAVVAKVSALGLSVGGVTLPVLARKAPVHRQKMDHDRMVTVSAAEATTRRRRFGLWATSYAVDVVLLAPYTGADADPQYSAARDSIVDALKGLPLSGAPDVFDVDCQPADWLRPLGETSEWDWFACRVTASVAHA